MKHLIRLISALCLLHFVSCESDERERASIPEPTFVTSDIELFWQIYSDSLRLSSEEFQNLYIDQGSVGLQEYARQKKLAPALASTLSSPAYIAYYKTIQPNTQDLSEAIDISKQAFYDLKEIAPAINFYPVYFLVGAMTAGGRISGHGLLIAVEMFSKNEDTPLDMLSEWHQHVIRNKEYVPSIVVHEFVHMQQNFRPNHANFRTNLEQSIMEGMADFISFHLLEDAPFVNEHLHSYGDPKEEQIWKEFESNKDQNYQNTEWLYTGSTTAKGHPADMGYYVGFKILESYSETFASVEEALVAMLAARDYEEIFERSGYANKFD